jgi:hypothetical protein
MSADDFESHKDNDTLQQFLPGYPCQSTVECVDWYESNDYCCGVYISYDSTYTFNMCLEAIEDKTKPNCLRD